MAEGATDMGRIPLPRMRQPTYSDFFQEASSAVVSDDAGTLSRTSEEERREDEDVRQMAAGAEAEAAPENNEPTVHDEGYWFDVIAKHIIFDLP